ncbi:MAG: acyl-homoserine-lactone synthase [Alphaproteobacteria bacterium]|nr:acyl-homoserine-lactone synthase [Alphaproteobacteria bacterium]
MLEIVQAGQAGKTRLLFDMHRLRKRVFKDRMGWPVTVTEGGLEIDQFDLPEALYLLALNNDGKVIGNWRLLPTTGSTMVRDVWPQFLESLPMPSSSTVWEASRFAVDSPDGQSEESLAQINRATQELFCGLTELSIMCGIKQIYTLYDMRIARLLKRLDCPATARSTRLKIDDLPVETGLFTMDQNMLDRLRAASGLHEPLIKEDMLPEVLQNLRSQTHSTTMDYCQKLDRTFPASRTTKKKQAA